MPVEELERVLTVNLTGPFVYARELARAGLATSPHPDATMSTSRASTSACPVAALRPLCASRAGVKLLGETIARELGPHEVRVVQIARDDHRPTGSTVFDSGMTTYPKFV
jgi:NAD(P)-dependent dehydrogenase (short-subunit alcohol dehydrogenase family)